MLLDKFMTDRKITNARGGEELGVTPECVRLWRKQKRVPRPDQIRKIDEWSGGLVALVDHYPPAPSEVAA